LKLVALSIDNSHRLTDSLMMPFISAYETAISFNNDTIGGWDVCPIEFDFFSTLHQWIEGPSLSAKGWADGWGKASRA